MKSTMITEIIAILFVILFLYTGFSKLMDYSIFKEQIETSPLLAPVSGVIAILLPTIEIVISIILFIPRWRLKGLYASVALMILFTVYIIYIFNFNEKLPCSCGGIIESLSWKGHIIFNCVFIVLGLTAIILARLIRPEKNNDSGHPPIAYGSVEH